MCGDVEQTRAPKAPVGPRRGATTMRPDRTLGGGVRETTNVVQHAPNPRRRRRLGGVVVLDPPPRPQRGVPFAAPGSLVKNFDFAKRRRLDQTPQRMLADKHASPFYGPAHASGRCGSLRSLGPNGPELLPAGTCWRGCESRFRRGHRLLVPAAPTGSDPGRGHQRQSGLWVQCWIWPSVRRRPDTVQDRLVGTGKVSRRAIRPTYAGA